jgi:integrase
MRGKSYRVRVSYMHKQLDIGTFPTLEIARAALNRARIDMIEGRFIPPAERRRMEEVRLEAEKAANVTVTDWYERWIKQLESDPLRPRSPATIVSYKSTIKTWVLPDLGDKRLVDVTPDDVETIVAAAAKSGPGAANNVVRHLRSMMNAAVEVGAGGLTKSPVEVKLERVKARRRTDDEIPTLAELNAIVARMPEQLQLAPLLATWAALRVGELLGLQRQDFRHLDDPERAELRISRQWNVKGHGYTAPKDASAGTVALPEFLLPAIRDHLGRYVSEAPDAPVFASVTDSGKPLSYNALRDAWRAATKGERLPFALHALRHLGLTEYARAGATTAEIMRRGRHKDAAASARYQHSSAERDRTLVTKLNSLLEGGSK